MQFPLAAQILTGLVLGAITGLVMGESASVLQPIGDIFIRLIRMIIVPLIFACVVSGLTNVQDPRRLGRIGYKAVSLYLATTVLAVFIGLLVVEIIKPGAGAALPETANNAATDFAIPSAGEFITSFFPSNPFESMSTGNMLQIIVFAIFVGLAINRAGDAGRPFKEFADSVSAVMIQLTGIVMIFAPIGVWAIMAGVVGSQGIDALLSLLKLIASVYLACLLHMALVHANMLRFLAGVNPLIFFKKITEGQLVAFSTSSSAATMPVTLRVTEKKLGVSIGTASFVIPLGMTINMDGSAMNFVIGTIFVAQAAGIDLTFAQYALILIISALTSIGTAGVPGVSAGGFLITLAAVGLPLEGIALLIAVDRLSDMARTAVNVTGDAAVAVTVDSMEQTLDKEQYYATNER